MGGVGFGDITRKADWCLGMKEDLFHLEWAENEAFSVEQAA